MSKYILQCLGCGKEHQDDHFMLKCDEEHEPALLRTVYLENHVYPRDGVKGMFKYKGCLPVKRVIETEGAPLTYRSEGLSRYLGLKNLYIIFNGYWPEKGANMVTASFKELEAPSVLSRVPDNTLKTIVVASAGNTGRAFAYVCSKNRIPLLLVIPEKNAREIWSVEPFNDCVRLVLASGNSDYFDAITLANRITNLEGFFPEGGTQNVARRDGMGTTVLDAAHVMGRVPDHYFQAIGSGAGAIAAWESYLRLIESGVYNGGVMKLHLSQNYPFIPMVEAWNKGMKQIPSIDEGLAKNQIDNIRAKVLSNRKPPYSTRGGVYDVLKASCGNMYSVTNQEVDQAIRLFREYENIDIHPAAGVALGSLFQAVKKNKVGKNDYIALNITGGGAKRVEQDFNIHYLEPSFKFTDVDIHSEQLEDKLEQMLSAV